jgi:hypothetical protein
MLLDPHGPLRSKDFVAMPLGIGATLTDAFNRRDSDAIDRIRECLSNGSAVDWYKLKDETEAVIFDKEIKQFTYIQQFLADSALGYQCLCTLSDVQRRRSRLAPVFRPAWRRGHV